MTNDTLIANGLEESPFVFSARFSRCRGLLCFIARKVLRGNERAESAVHNCFVTASRHPPRFEYEGAFRCWLLRVLIDEALLILHEERERPSISREVNIGLKDEEAGWLRAS